MYTTFKIRAKMSMQKSEGFKMKIIVDGKAYVQLNDIMYLINGLDGVSIPASIFNTVFKDGKPVVCTDENRYEFVEFTDKDAIKFFVDLDFSVDYLALKDLSEEEMIQKGVEVAEEKNKWAKKYNEMSDEDKRKNQAIVSKCEMLDFKMMSIRDIVWMKQGHLKIKLPKIDTEEKKEKGINKIKKFFGRR